MKIRGVWTFNIWHLPREYACFQKIDVYGKSIENGRQKDSKNDVKIKLWALRGLIFEILGGFLRGLIFDELLIGQKAEKNMIFEV